MLAPWKKSYDQPRQCIKKQRHYFADKDLPGKSYSFSSSHVWMWELDYKESWASKNWCLWTMVMEKTLESPLDSKEIQPVHPKGNQSWIFIGRKAMSNISSIQFSRSVVFDSLRPHESQDARTPCPSPFPRVHSDSRPSSPWCHPAVSSSVVPFSCPQSLPASESFPMSQLFTWGGQSTGVSALASLLPRKSQGWSPSEWTGWISLQSKGLSRVFSNTTVQKHQFFGAQPSSKSISHIHTWPLEKP